jgi:predicted nucleotidyltransferase
MSNPKLTSILNQLRRELLAILGSQFERLVLFGSQARGDARPDSDIDVIVIVTEPFNLPDLRARTSESVARICLEHDVVISRFFVSSTQYAQAQTAFLRNIQREGVAV